MNSWPLAVELRCAFNGITFCTGKITILGFSFEWKSSRAYRDPKGDLLVGKTTRIIFVAKNSVESWAVVGQSTKKLRAKVARTSARSLGVPKTRGDG